MKQKEPEQSDPEQYGGRSTIRNENQLILGKTSVQIIEVEDGYSVEAIVIRHRVRRTTELTNNELSNGLVCAGVRLLRLPATRWYPAIVRHWLSG